MRLFLGLTALALAVPLLAQDKREEVVEIGEVPSMSAGRLSRDERDQQALFVRLGAEGAIQLKRGEEWKDASLDNLAKALAEELQRLGDEGCETLERGLKVSKLFVSIAADPAAPWQHLQWLMTVAAEQKYYKIELSDGARRMLAYLPCDRGIPPKEEEPPKEIIVPIHLMARMEKARKWNDKQVVAPTTVLYRFGEQDSEDPKSVAGWIRKARKAAEPELKPGGTLLGEIKAGNKVPFASVFDVMAAFLDEGLPAVSLHSATLPAAEIRALTVLPYPAKNY